MTADRAVRPAGRPLAPLEDLRRALPRPVRAQARLRRSRCSAWGSSTAPARWSTSGRSRRPSSTSSAGSRRPARSRSWTPAARPPSAWSTWRTSRGSCCGARRARDLGRERGGGDGHGGRRRARSPAASAPEDEPAWTVASPFDYRHALTRLPRGRLVKLLVIGASGFLGSRVTQHLRERGHDVVAVTRPGRRDRAALAEVLPCRGRCRRPRGPRADRGLRRGPALRRRSGPRGRPPGPRARRARERGHDAQPARGLRRARRRARLPVVACAPRWTRRPTRTRCRSAWARRPAGCTRRGATVAPPHVGVRARASSCRRAPPAQSRPSRGARWRASRS